MYVRLNAFDVFLNLFVLILGGLVITWLFSHEKSQGRENILRMHYIDYDSLQLFMYSGSSLILLINVEIADLGKEPNIENVIAEWFCN